MPGYLVPTNTVDQSTTIGGYNVLNEIKSIGLEPVIPTSASVGTGSYSINSNGRVSFTGASTVSLNGCFTSKYKAYKILVSARHDSTATWNWLRLRKNLSDAGTGAYWNTGSEINTSSASVIRQNDVGITQGFRVFISGAFMKGFGEINLLNPSTTDVPSYTSSGQGYFNAVNYVANMGGFYDSPGSGVNTFDGFTLYPNSGSFAAGTIQVYGYSEDV
jgi:hypothetical protein